MPDAPAPVGAVVRSVLDDPEADAMDEDSDVGGPAVERHVAMSALDDPEADPMDEDSDVGLGGAWDEPPQSPFASSVAGDGAWQGPPEEARVRFGRARCVSVVAVSHLSGCIRHRGCLCGFSRLGCSLWASWRFWQRGRCRASSWCCGTAASW
jgi:hypothetical protein